MKFELYNENKLLEDLTDWPISRTLWIDMMTVRFSMGSSIILQEELREQKERRCIYP
jgi:hypothetical protein